MREAPQNPTFEGFLINLTAEMLDHVESQEKLKQTSQNQQESKQAQT